MNIIDDQLDTLSSVQIQNINKPNLKEKKNKINNKKHT